MPRPRKKWIWIALPTSQPFINQNTATPLEQRRTAQDKAIDAWLPPAIDKYLAAHGGPR